MKNRSYLWRLISTSSVLFLSSYIPCLAADTDQSTTSAPAPVVSAPSATAPSSATPAEATNTNLPYGTAEIVKLSRAQVSDDVIISYVQNSGIAYNLSAQDIARLREQGVSDRVINAVLDQQKKVQLARQPSAPAVSSESAPPNASSNPGPQPAPTYTQTPVVEAPLTPPASAAPYPAPDYGYYGPYYYPYYYGGWYGGPIVTFRFGFGGHHHHWH